LSSLFTRVYLGIGSNIHPEANIALVLPHLKQMFDQFRLSPTYVCPAVGFDGPDFWNLVATGLISSPLEQLAADIRQLELAGGRLADAKKYSSRTIDIDILFYGQMVCDSPVQLPRKEITTQAFVLKPLADIAPNFIHPVAQESIASLWSKMAPTVESLNQLDKDW
tara:strand:- start:4283 stop:4780 length:498 start_codon:yes stop_codon:yes gene_type:complete